MSSSSPESGTSRPSGWDGPAAVFTDKQAADFHKSGIPAQEALSRGAYPARTPAELPPGFAKFGTKIFPCVVLPWPTESGQIFQLRMDEPTTDSEGKPRKYLFTGEHGQILGRIKEGTPEGPIVLIEGWKQAVSFAQHAAENVTVLAMFGCWGVSKLSLSFATERDLIIVLDGDIKTNPSVWDAGKKLATKAEYADAATCRFADLPTTGTDGVDDYLGREPEAVRPRIVAKIIEKAGDLPRKRPSERRSRRSQVEAAQEGTGFFLEGNLQVQDMATHILGERRAALISGGRFVIYKNGAYHYDPNTSPFREAITRILGNLYKNGHETNVANSVEGALQRSGLVIKDEADEPWLNCAGTEEDPGVLVNVHTGEVKDWTPDFLAIGQIAVRYDDQATCPVFDKWIKEVCPHQVEELLDASCTMLDRSRAATKAILLFGPTRSAKGTYMRLMQEILGRPNVAGVSLHDLCGGSRFTVAELYGMMASFDGDISKQHIGDPAMFKKATGDDVIDADPKFGRKFKFKNTATLFFGANSIPSISENSQAVVGRLKAIHFPNSYLDREDPTIEAAMMQELPGILNRLLAAAKAKASRGHRYLPTPDHIRDYVKASTNTVYQWFQDQTIFTTQALPLDRLEDHLVTSGIELHRLFKIWSEGEGGLPMKKKNFLEILESLDGVARVISKSNNEGYNIRVDAKKAAKRRRDAETQRAKDYQTQKDAEEENQAGPPPAPPEPETPTEPETPEEPPAEPTAPPLPEGVIAIDIETASGEELFSYGEGFYRLGGYSNSDGTVHLTEDGNELAKLVAEADITIGHRAIGYDLLLLAKYHDLDLDPFIDGDKIFYDTRIAAIHDDPPPSQMKDGEARSRYSLNGIAKRLGVPTKSDDIKRLAKKHGGFDAIPTDDPEYRAYLRDDIICAAAVAVEQIKEDNDDPQDPS